MESGYPATPPAVNKSCVPFSLSLFSFVSFVIGISSSALFDMSEADRVFRDNGLDEFMRHESKKANIPLPEGPFATLLKVLHFLQRDPEFKDRPPVRVALVTARSMPAHERVLTTLEDWGVRVDEAYFMGGVDKTPILKAFRPHVYFDDQTGHCERAAGLVPLISANTQAANITTTTTSVAGETGQAEPYSEVAGEVVGKAGDQSA